MRLRTFLAATALGCLMFGCTNEGTHYRFGDAPLTSQTFTNDATSASSRGNILMIVSPILIELRSFARCRSMLPQGHVPRELTRAA